MRPPRTCTRPLLAGCDTVVALPGATASGVALFGKNSDRPPDEPQAPVLLERARHPAGATVRCQYVDVAQVRETARVLGSRPTWLWGLEMGVNEHGVAIGNETVFAHEAPAASGLTGMDLVRLGLERAATAPAALAVLVELIETHGQGGSGYRDMTWPYNNSFLIADPREAWILEAAGRQWAARRCREIDSVSNHISIGQDWDRLGAGTVARARAAGSPVADPFDFALAYRDADAVPRALSEGRLRRSRALLAAGGGAHTRATLRAILRDHDMCGSRFTPGATPDQEQFYTVCMHQGPSRTAASLVAELEPDPSAPRVVWLALGRPCTSLYFPLLLAGALPEPLLGAGAEGAPGREGLWWVFERLAAAVESSASAAPAIEEALSALASRLEAEVASVRRALVGASGDACDARASAFAASVAQQVDATARGLAAARAAT
jgi:dipeptidase